MRDNITDPPREFTELALRISEGSVEFFRSSVTKWAREAAGSNDFLFTEFQSANRKAVLAFELSANFLGTERCLCRGSYSIGPDVFIKKLRYEEMIEDAAR